MRRLLGAALMLACSGCGDAIGAKLHSFDVPGYYCGSYGNVETGRINGTPIYELKCLAYFPETPERQSAAGHAPPVPTEVSE